MSFDELSPELRILLFCMHWSPSDSQREQVIAQLSSGVNHESLYALAEEHGLQMLLYRGLAPLSAQLPNLEELVQRLGQELTVGAVLYEFVYPQALADILKALSEAGVDTVLLKGYALGQMLYNQPTLRFYSDFDLLVRVEQLDAAERQMTVLGYEPDEQQYPRTWYRENHHHLAPFVRDGSLPVEVHWNLVEPAVSGHMQIDLDSIWTESRSFNVNDVTTRILCLEHLLVHLSIHAVTIHFFEMGLKPLCDVCTLLERYGERLDWDKLIRTSLDWRCGRQVYLMLRLVSELFEIKLPEAALRRLSPEDIAPSFLEYSLVNVLSTAIVGLPESSGLAQIWQEKNAVHRWRFIARQLFPPRVSISEQYGLQPRDPRLWLYYPGWQFKFIQRHLKNALRLLRADHATLESARYEAMRRELSEWLNR